MITNRRKTWPSVYIMFLPLQVCTVRGRYTVFSAFYRTNSILKIFEKKSHDMKFKNFPPCPFLCCLGQKRPSIRSSKGIFRRDEYCLSEAFLLLEFLDGYLED